MPVPTKSTVIKQNCCFTLYYCTEKCWKLMGNFVWTHHETYVNLRPVCGGRLNCSKCIQAKDKNSLELPCKLQGPFFTFMDVCDKQPQFLTAVKDLLDLFMTFLVKHENDQLKNSDQKLNCLFKRCEHPPKQIIHLYVTFIYEISKTFSLTEIREMALMMCQPLIHQ